MICPECYSDHPRATPLLRPLECLQNHTQYICGTCGRCICIEPEARRGLRRWNFPFQSLENAKLYLRTADYTTKRCCGIYAIKSRAGRTSYKIFAGGEELELFLQKNPDKCCEGKAPLFTAPAYREFAHTQVRRLTPKEALDYSAQRQGQAKGTAK